MVTKPDGSHGMLRRFYDDTYNLRTISTRRLWVNAFLFPCGIALVVFGITSHYESQRVLEARGVVVDAVVVQGENSLELEIPGRGGDEAQYVHSPDDALAVGDVVTIRYDPLDPTNFAPTMERGLAGSWVLLGVLMVLMAGLWAFQTVELIGRLTGRRRRQPRNLGFNLNPRFTD